MTTATEEKTLRTVVAIPLHGDAEEVRKALTPIEEFIQRLKADKAELKAELQKARDEIIELRGELQVANKKAIDANLRACAAERQISDAQHLFGTGLLQEGDEGAVNVLEAILFKPDCTELCPECDCPKLYGSANICANCDANGQGQHHDTREEARGER